MNERRPRAMTPSRGLVLQLVAGCVVFVMLLGAIELGVRLWAAANGLSRPDTEFVFTGEFVASALLKLHRTPSRSVQDVRLLWRNEPLVTVTLPVDPRPYGQERTWTFHTNSKGFRGPELQTDDRREDVYRILCVGDSVTFGYNVDQHDTYPSHISRLLVERFPEHRFEVINAGVPGWSWVQGARFTLEEGLALRPDLVIAAHGTNDQFWPARITDREHLWLRDQPMLGVLQRLNVLAMRSVTYRLLATSAARETTVPLSPGCRVQEYQFGGCKRVSVPEIEETVHSLDEQTNGAGVELIVANLDFYESAAAEALRRVTQKYAIPLLDYVPVFRKRELDRHIKEAQALGLAWPHVPLVSFGAVGPPAPKNRGPSLLLRVRHAKGLRLSVSGVGGADFEFDELLYDDGTNGDEKPNDGVYSATIHTPPLTSFLNYNYRVDDAPEFELMIFRGARKAPRMIRFNRDAIAPIDHFATMPLMADMVHPDAEGQKLIATALMEKIDQVPSFRSFVNGAVE